MSHFISVEEFVAALDDPDLYPADCRFDLAAPLLGWIQYRESHVPGARYISIDHDLSDSIGPHGGRHPLPSPKEIARRFSALGIARGKSRVVAYDSAGGGFAARLWWMLKYCGHDDVRLLDGGWQAWERAGGPVTDVVPGKRDATFIANERPSMLAQMDDVRRRNAHTALVDARAHERYAGETEPIDPVAGHIPGAVNIPWQANLRPDLLLKDREELRAIYAALPADTVLYCGSGVTSAFNVLVMDELGLPLPRLYAGSWSDWITHEGNPAARS